MSVSTIPYPPIDQRRLVSPIIDDSYYDNPSGESIWGPLEIGPLAAGEAYERVFDFGCGCGREARRLLLQRQRPKSYVGVDINRPMIEWCQQHLSYDGFTFQHHDVWNLAYGPDNAHNRMLPI